MTFGGLGLRQTECEQTLREMETQLQRLLHGINEMQVDGEETSETRSRRYALQCMEDSLWQVLRIARNMDAQICAVGKLLRSDQGEYVIDGDNQPFKEASEIHIFDENEQRWIYSVMFHNGQDYYIEALGDGVPISGKLVRRPQFERS